MPEILQPHLRDARFFLAEDWQTDVRQEIGPDHEYSQLVIADLGRVAQRLAKVPHDETNLNIPRMRQHLESYGLSTGSFVGLKKAGQRAVNRISGYKPDEKNSATSSEKKPKIVTTGAHLQLPDYTYGLRGKREKICGPEMVEASGVHEWTHKSQSYKEVLLVPNPRKACGFSYMLMQSGFVDYRPNLPTGKLLGEGEAELLAHAYIVEPLNLPNGFLDMREPLLIPATSGREYFIPGSFAFPAEKTGEPRCRTTTHAAFCLQLMIAQDPRIFPALLAAPRSEEALREFDGRVDALDPGILKKLRDVQYGLREFEDAALLVIDRLYDGNVMRALGAATEFNSPRELLAA